MFLRYLLQFQKKLKDKGIPTAIYYPKCLHLQDCFKYLDYKLGDFENSEMISNEIISLPMNPYIDYKTQEYIVNEIKKII